MGRIDDLAVQFSRHISAPWQRNLAGPQRTVFLVYDKADERRVRAKVGLFEEAAVSAGHKWIPFNVTDAFARWMSSMDYRNAYFEEPSDLNLKLQSDFVRFVSDELRTALNSEEADEDAIIAVLGAGCLYGFTKVSLVIKEVERDVRGRLVLFFPGTYENHNYRLLDARDGWNYLAVPITLHGSEEPI